MSASRTSTSLRTRVPWSMRTSGSTPTAALLLAAALASGCGSAPPSSPPPVKVDRSYAVLLDNGDGTTGQLSVTGPGGKTVLTSARTGTMLSGQPGNQFAADDVTLQTDFAAAVAASPRRPVTYRLYFEFGTSRLTALSRSEAPRILDEIAKRPAPDISIVGHTDTSGDDAANVELGLARAKVVGELLGASNRLSPDRIWLESHGEKNLLVMTADKVDEPRNRRVEVTVR
ncbi:hypothetical protein BH09PSE5_BH09PSE5_02690 [soil metagenome]